MRVVFDDDDREIEIDYEGDAGGLLEELGINPHSVVLVKNRKVIKTDENLVTDDTVIVLPVVLGG